MILDMSLLLSENNPDLMTDILFYVTLYFPTNPITMTI
jgi:hypothetical protein